MFFRLKRDNGSGNNPGNWFPANPADTQQYTPQFPSLQAVLSETFVVKPNLINEFRAGIYREVQTRTFLSSNKDFASQLGLVNSNGSLFPHFGFSAPGAGYGLGAGNSLQQWLQTIQYSDAMTYIRGQHSLKFGGDFRFNQVNKLSGRDSASGNFSFSGAYTSDPNNSTAATVSMADFLLGMPSSYTIQPPDFKWGARKREASWFVQDDWKLSRRLTVNLGLRQDLQFSWHEAQDRYAGFSPTVIQPALLPTGRPLVTRKPSCALVAGPSLFQPAPLLIMVTRGKAKRAAMCHSFLRPRSVASFRCFIYRAVVARQIPT